MTMMRVERWCDRHGGMKFGDRAGYAAATREGNKRCHVVTLQLGGNLFGAGTAVAGVAACQACI